MHPNQNKDGSNSAIQDISTGNIVTAALNGVSNSDSRQFQERLIKNLPLLIDRLNNLYGNNPNYESWLISLAGNLGRWYNERPSSLRDLDNHRLANPDWFQSQEMIAYSAYVDRFAGTLNGIENRIPHLKELGVRYLHLLPFLRARAGENDGGFAVESYDEVAPVLGNTSDLEHLTNSLRKNGISLCSDFVLNHVADTHKWAVAAANRNNEFREYFHIISNKATVDSFEETLGQVFPQTAPNNFTYVPEIESWVWTTFYPYQWDLNYANPAVFLEMTGALIGLANQGVEVFRLDSTAYLWKRLGTNCMNQPEAHIILQALRAIVNIVAPGVLLKAEAIVPAPELPPYFGIPDFPGQECHLAYQSSVMSAIWVCLAEQNSGLLRKVLNDSPILPKGTSWLTYVRCHDDIGWNVLRGDIETNAEEHLAWVSRFYSGEIEGSYAHGKSFQAVGANHVHGTNGMTSALTGFIAAEGNKLEEASRRFLLLYGIVFVAGGIPLIYMGDEFALGNDATPIDSWPLGADGRQLHRPVLSSQIMEDAYNPNSATGKFFTRFKALIKTRCSLRDLAASTPARVLDYPHPGVLAIQRGKHLLCLFNFSATPVRLDLSAENNFSRVRDELTGEKFENFVPILGYGMRWLTSINTQ